MHNVLFLNTSEFFGPVMQVHKQVIKHLDRSRYKVFVATNRRGDSKISLQALDDVVIREWNFGSTFQGKRTFLQKIRNIPTVWQTPYNFFGLLAFVRKQRIDIIHSPSQPRALFLSVLLTFLSKAKLVVHVHGGSSSAMSIGTRMLSAYELRRASAVITVSGFMQKRVLALGVKESKVHPIMNAADLDRFHPSVSGCGVREEFKVRPDAGLVLVIGRITPEKGQIDFLKAIKLVKRNIPGVHGMVTGWDAKYPMPGRRTYLRYLKDYCRENGLESAVTFTGPRKDIERFYAAADVIVIPSAYQEPFGLVVIEAMAMAKPLVATRSGGIPEIIEEGVTGILVDRRSPEQLADAITRLLYSSELRDRLGRQARLEAEKRFYERRLADEVSTVYASILDS